MPNHLCDSSRVGTSWVNAPPLSNRFPHLSMGPSRAVTERCELQPTSCRSHQPRSSGMERLCHVASRPQPWALCSLWKVARSEWAYISFWTSYKGALQQWPCLSLGVGKCHLLEAPVWNMFCPREWSLQMGNLKGNFVGNFWSPLCADIEKTVKCRYSLVPFIVLESACYILWFCTSMPAVWVVKFRTFVLPEAGGTTCQCSAKVKWTFVTAWQCLNCQSL